MAISLTPAKSYYDPILDAMVAGSPGKVPQPTKSQLSELKKLNVKQAQYEAANAPAPVVPKTEPVVPTTTYPEKGTIIGYEYSPNKTMRKPQIADGKGGYTTGSWESNPDKPVITKPPVGGDSGSGAGTGVQTIDTTPTTSVDVLKAMLKGTGFSSSLVDSATSFLSNLLKDGLDYNNAVEIFLNSKDYTFKNGKKETSPFYTEYGYLNDNLTSPKGASELYNAVEGYKGIKEKYSLSDKFTSKEAIAKYVKNNVSVDALDERAGMARLKAINSDAAYTEALQRLGFIKTPADLTDFFLNPDIGEQQLKDNRNLAAFSAEAVRRAKSGITLDENRYRQIVAGLTAKGLTEQQISATAATGFENIGQDIQPLVGLSGMYERGAYATEEQRQQGIQSELLQQEFIGTASELRKRLAEQNVRGFQGSAGTISSMYPTLAGASLRTSPLAGTL